MSLIKDLIGLTIAETASEAIKTKLEKWSVDSDKKNLDAIEKLKALYDSGAITEREYKKKKKELLKKLK